jgi:hypothetical protein
MTNLFKKLLGKMVIDDPQKNIDHPYSINAINRKLDEIEVDFIVPSKKLYFISIFRDSFTGDKTIKFKILASMCMDKLMTWCDGEDTVRLDFGFRSINGNKFLSFSTYQKSLKLNKGDKILFLFSDNEILEFELLEKGYRIEKDSGGIMIESVSNISDIQIEKFSKFNLLKWRFAPLDDRKPITGTIKLENQIDTKEMTMVFKYVLENPIT